MDITVEYYDAAQSDVTAQVQRLKTANVGVIVFLGGPVQAANMIKTARETLSWDVPMTISSVNAIDLMAPLAGLDNIEGVVSATIGHQAWETDIPGIVARKEIMARYAPDRAIRQPVPERLRGSREHGDGPKAGRP